jgi:hypothetical protein
VNLILKRLFKEWKPWRMVKVKLLGNAKMYKLIVFSPRKSLMIFFG